MIVEFFVEEHAFMDFIMPSQNIGLDYVWSFIVIHINIRLNFDIKSNVNLHDAVILHSPDSIHGKFPVAPRSVISFLPVVTSNVLYIILDKTMNSRAICKPILRRQFLFESCYLPSITIKPYPKPWSVGNRLQTARLKLFFFLFDYKK